MQRPRGRSCVVCSNNNQEIRWPEWSERRKEVGTDRDAEGETIQKGDLASGAPETRS